MICLVDFLNEAPSISYQVESLGSRETEDFNEFDVQSSKAKRK